jgi:uncharacterized protein YbaR (Trm112 family)
MPAAASTSRSADAVLDQRLRSLLVCPEDRGPLLLIGNEFLYNPRLRRAYRIEDGVPVLLISEATTITDDPEHAALVERAET